jgi:hypothetical protein
VDEWMRSWEKSYAEKQARQERARATAETCGKCGRPLSSEDETYLVRDGGGPVVPMCEKCAPGWLTSGTGKPMRIVPAITVRNWECEGCGRAVIFGMSQAQEPYRKYAFCSDACRAKPAQERRGASLHEKVCEACGTGFTSKRSDARTCSPACRQKAHRKRASFAGE